MKTASDPRHQERQKSISELFAWDAHQKSPEKPSSPLSGKAKDVIENLAEIDAIIKLCAPEWEIDRINQIDLAILRLAIFELVVEPTVPAKVIIDESIELAKEFGSETSPSFINGALGKALLLPNRLKKVISVKLGIEEDKLTDDSNLTTDLNATDLEISDLLTLIEKEYNIQFEKNNTPETVGDLIATVEDQID